ncbi:DUF4150 domain-containing protein [Rhizobacter sp. J219]|uniref:PAAR-like domain-containing protein n=1 Tax=Rhizobacter sp. J219 TaxID=2898430 RepID=UPI002151AB38|nr:PAAR-like domain-containing protein [Rhizobacter sp. J219]MCR5882471.1 DUF4150 domain-containing protein [Rhizobacter sp. J219]
MANDVYANGMEVSCKAGSGKATCAFPDVCFTPPQTPATPPGVPIPYPNTGMDSDASDGSTTVKIGGQEVMLKNKSYFKKSTGDEAGSAPKKGVVTSKITGKVYFNAWSMDVKVEGENVVRNLDLTTHNHASFPGDTPTWPFIAKQSVTKETGPCKDEIKNEKKACKNCTPHKKGGKDPCSDPKCQKARQCMLVPFNATAKTVDKPNAAKCCDGKTGHHVVPVQEFSKTRSALPGGGTRPRGEPLNNDTKGYNQDAAPTVCAEGEVHNEWESKSPYPLKEHGRLGNAYIAARKSRGLKTNQKVAYSTLSDCGAESVNAVFPHCSKECIQEQLDNYHVKSANIPPDKKCCRVSSQGTQKAFKPKKGKRM